MGLIAVFFEKVPGNKRLMDVMRSRLEEYKNGDLETQVRIKKEILTSLREDGVRILRVRKETIEEGIEGVRFDDVGGRFTLDHLLPFLFEWHLGAEEKEDTSRCGGSCVTHQLIAYSLLAEKDGASEEDVVNLLESLARFVPEKGTGDSSGDGGAEGEGGEAAVDDGSVAESESESELELDSEAGYDDEYALENDEEEETESDFESEYDSSLDYCDTDDE